MSNKKELLGGLALGALGVATGGFGLLAAPELAAGGLAAGAAGAGEGAAGAGLLGATMPEVAAGAVTPMLAAPQMAVGGALGSQGVMAGTFGSSLAGEGAGVGFGTAGPGIGMSQAAAPLPDYISGGGLMSGGMDGSGSDFTTMQRLGSNFQKFGNKGGFDKLFKGAQMSGLLNQQQPQHMQATPPMPMQQPQMAMAEDYRRRGQVPPFMAGSFV